MSNYINENKIQAIAAKCSEILTPENKNTIRKIEKKHGLQFCESAAHNANIFWKYSKEKLIKDSRRVLRNGKTVQDSMEGMEIYNNSILGYNIVSFNLHIQDYIQDYIADNFQSDYDFLCEFDVKPIFDLITQTAIIEGENNCVSDIPTLNELLDVQDYFKFFNNKYGVGSVDPNEVLITKRITDFFDQMFSGVKNRDYIIKNISEYLVNGDVAELHTKLFKNFNPF